MRQKMVQRPARFIKSAISTLLLLLFLGNAYLGAVPLDIKQIPITDEAHIVAIDIQVNPTSMPDMMLWDRPILLVYYQVESFENLRIDALREEITTKFKSGEFRPVVLRGREGSDYRIHFMNAIGIGEAPVRVVQGRICKTCTGQKAYTFSYGPNAEQGLWPFRASIHPHGVAYTVENDGTNAGNNPVNFENGYGLTAPGETREYYYKELDTPGLWPMHDHANTAHSVSRGLHMAFVVEPKEEKVSPAHDFLLIFSDYPDYEEYLDEFYGQTFVPPFLHMRNANVMHAHALNGYAEMLMPRMMRAMNNGGTRWDAMRSDIAGDPRTPVLEVKQGDLVRIRLLSYGTQTTHSFHLHAHVWWNRQKGKYVDNTAVAAGDSEEIMFYAGGPAYRQQRQFPFKKAPVRSGPGDWLFHCHVIPHVKHGMWGILRVTE